MELNLQEARDQRDDWDRLDEKGKRRLKPKVRHSRLKAKSQHTGLNLVVVEQVAADIALIVPEILDLDRERKCYIDAVDKITEERASAMKAWKQFRINRKSEDASLYTKVDNILERFQNYSSSISWWRHQRHRHQTTDAVCT